MGEFFNMMSNKLYINKTIICIGQFYQDLVNIMVGAYVGVLAKSTDYWFKDKEDSEDKEMADHNENAKQALQNGKDKEE